MPASSPIELAVQSMPKRRRRRVRPARFPRGIERQYEATARDIEQAKQNLVRELLIERLPELARLAGLRADAAHVDQSPWRALLRVIMRDIEQRHARAESFAREAARETAQQTSVFNRNELARQVRSAIGFDIFAEDPGLVDLLEQFEADNVSHIVTTDPANFATIERVVSQGFQSGQRASTIADSLVGVLGVQQSRALFWARDQIGTLNSQLTQARQRAIGVEQYVWRTSMDERVRETHRQLEGTIHSWDDPPTVGQREVHPGEDYNCLYSLDSVASPALVSIAYRRRYRGNLTTLVTASGKAVNATPNHPVLTTRGIVPAHDVQIGENLVGASRQAFDFCKADDQYREIAIEQVFQFLAEFFPVERVAGVGVQFHGDGTDEEVEIVRTDWCLSDKGETGISKAVCEEVLAAADVLFDFCSADSALAQRFWALGFPSHSLVRGLQKMLTLGFIHGGPTRFRGLMAVARLQSRINQMSVDRRPRHAQVVCNAFDAFAFDEPSAHSFWLDLLRFARHGRKPKCYPSISQSQPERDRVSAESFGDFFSGKLTAPVGGDRVVEKRFIDDFQGHVYNLETQSGWYITKGCIVCNCRCTPDPVIPGVSIEQTGPEDVPRDPELVKRKRARDRRARENARRREAGLPPIERRPRGRVVGKPLPRRIIPARAEARSVRLPRTGRTVNLTPEQALRQDVAKSLTDRQTRRAATTGQRLDRLLWQWVHGSQRKPSIELKQAAIQEFRLRGIAYNPRRLRVDPADVRQSASDLRALFRRTQKHLAEQGRQRLKLYRGIKGEVGQRGAVESWTTSRRQAERFAGRGGRVLEETVPAERILAIQGGPHWQDGVWGNQGEVVVMY